MTTANASTPTGTRIKIIGNSLHTGQTGQFRKLLDANSEICSCWLDKYAEIDLYFYTENVELLEPEKPDGYYRREF